MCRVLDMVVVDVFYFIGFYCYLERMFDRLAIGKKAITNLVNTSNLTLHMCQRSKYEQIFEHDCAETISLY
jgi:hypothetical protein